MSVSGMASLLVKNIPLVKISPTSIERLSGWMAFVWAVTCLMPLGHGTGSRTYRILVDILPASWWAAFFMVLFMVQVFGCAASPWPRFHVGLRLAGLWAAFLVWSFLGFHAVPTFGMGVPAWGIYLALAWSQACKIKLVAHGERRA